MVRNVAVIDIGKTNAKLALVDVVERREVEVYETPNVVRDDGPYPHHDVEALWAFVVEHLARVEASRGVGAVTATAHGAAAVLLDAAGELAVPMLDYEHDGPDSVADDYDRLRPAFADSGSPRLPHGFNLGAQLHWLLRTEPDLRDRLAHVVTYPQYWTGRLTGTWFTEISSLGCHTDLWLPRARRFSALVDELGLGGRFPPLRAAASAIGTIRPDLARQTGLAPTTPVHCGIHDSNASLYPHLLQRTGPFAVLSTGTWVITMSVGGRDPALDPERDTLMNVNALGEPVPSARFMGGREFELLTGGDPATPTAAEVASVLQRGAILAPAVVADCGPFQGRTAAWTVPETELSPGERTVVASFYLAMMAVTCLDITGAAGPILTEGPFVHNAPFLDLVAAATGREVLTATGSATGTSIGAALLAADPPSASETDTRHPAPTGEYHADLVRYAGRWRLCAES